MSKTTVKRSQSNITVFGSQDLEITIHSFNNDFLSLIISRKSDGLIPEFISIERRNIITFFDLIQVVREELGF